MFGFCCSALVAAKASPANGSRDNVARRSAVVFMVMLFRWQCSAMQFRHGSRWRSDTLLRLHQHRLRPSASATHPVDLIGISFVYDGFERLNSNFCDHTTLGPESHRTVNPRTTHSKLAMPLHVSQVEVALLERLFDRSPDVAFFVKDAAGRYVAVNESLLERHGLKSKSQVIGKCPRDICPGDFGRIPTEQDEKVLRTGRPLVDHLEMQWHRPNDPVWCLTTKLPAAGSTTRSPGLVTAPIKRLMSPIGFTCG